MKKILDVISTIPLFNGLPDDQLEAIKNIAIEKQINKGEIVVSEGDEGRGISSPMRADGVFPPLAMHMIRVGEETGRMEEMLMKVADTYDIEVQNAVKRFIAFLEPALIMIMAVIVVAVLFPMILALISINDVGM